MILCPEGRDKLFDVSDPAHFRRTSFESGKNGKNKLLDDIRRVGLLIRILTLYICLSTLLMAGFSESANARSKVTGARAGETEEATRFVLDLSENVPFRIYTLADPYRLVLDLLGATWALDDKQLTINRGLAETLRFGQFQSDTARIVVDLEGPATVKQVFVLPPGAKYRYRLVVDLKPVTHQDFRPSTVTSLEEPTRAAAQPTTARPVVEHKNFATVAPGADKVLLPAPARPNQVVHTSGAQRLIVIDPGHGGADPGAVVGNKTYEKHFTLAAAKALETMLLERGYDVLLSRRADKYMSLVERVDFAQSRRADLFISLHADKHKNNKVRGAAVYTLSEKSSDAETEALAARENEVDALFDVSNSEYYEDDVRKILISLVQRTTMTCSARFAAELIPELKKSTKLLGRTHRFAGFRVLKAPDVPSVLLEMGYMSNGQDREMLMSEERRYALMQRVAQAIDDYFLHHTTCSRES